MRRGAAPWKAIPARIHRADGSAAAPGPLPPASGRLGVAEVLGKGAFRPAGKVQKILRTRIAGRDGIGLTPPELEPAGVFVSFHLSRPELGRASWRERVCKYV